MILLPTTRQRIARLPLLFRAHEALDETGLYALSYGQRLYATVTRASHADVRDQSGVAVRVPQGMPRFSHLMSGGTRRRALLVEPTAAQLLTRASELDHADWTNVGSPVVTANGAVASDGSTTLDLIADTSGAEVRGRRYTATVANDGTSYVASIEVRKRTSAHSTGYVLINLRLTGGTGIDAYVVVDAFAGTATKNGAAVTGGIEDAGTSWRVYVGLTNNTTGNTSLLLSVYPGGTDTYTAATAVAGQGTEAFGRSQLETGLYPTTHVPRSSAAASRTGELIYWTLPGLNPAAALTFYQRLIELGTHGVASGRYGGITSAAGASPRLLHVWNGTGVRGFYENGIDAAVTSDPLAAYTRLDRLEARTALAASGAVQTFAAVNDGDEAAGTASGAPASGLAASWADTRVWLGSHQVTGSQGAAGHTHLAIGPAGITRDELRDLCEVG